MKKKCMRFLQFGVSSDMLRIDNICKHFLNFKIKMKQESKTKVDFKLLS